MKKIRTIRKLLAQDLRQLAHREPEEAKRIATEIRVELATIPAIGAVLTAAPGRSAVAVEE
jgi:hypothetical protein